MCVLFTAANQFTCERSEYPLEKEPPEFAGSFEAFGLERFNSKSRRSKLLCGMFDRPSDIRIERDIFESKPNADPLNTRCRIGNGDRGGEGISPVIACNHGIQEGHVLDTSCHGSDDAKQPSGMRDLREVPGCGDPAGSWLQTSDSTVMRGNTDGAASIAAHSRW